VTVLAVVKGARALIALENNWTKVHNATAGKGGAPVKPDDVSATCFCAIGACCKAAGVDVPEKGEVLDCALELGKTVEMPIALFNDLEKTLHKDVLKAFDDTVARLEQEKP
jgi:hypothetical protein